MVITNSGLTLKAKVKHFMVSNDKLTTIYSESSSWMKGERAGALGGWSLTNKVVCVGVRRQEREGQREHAKNNMYKDTRVNNVWKELAAEQGLSAGCRKAQRKTGELCKVQDGTGLYLESKMESGRHCEQGWHA